MATLTACSRQSWSALRRRTRLRRSTPSACERCCSIKQRNGASCKSWYEPLIFTQPTAHRVYAVKTTCHGNSGSLLCTSPLYSQQVVSGKS